MQMVNASAFILMLRSLIKVYTTSNTKKPHKLVYLDDLKENLRWEFMRERPLHG